MKKQSVFCPLLGLSLVLFVGVEGVLAQPPSRRARPAGRNGAATREANNDIGNARILSNLGSALLHPKIKDPLSSHLFALVKRADVYAELKITSRQRESLEKLQETLSEQLYAKMHEAVDADILDPAGLKELPVNERVKQIREFREQVRERSKGAIVEFQGDVEGELTKLLTAKQMTRLKQLDLQWRGPLALGDVRVSQPFELDDEQKVSLEDVIVDYKQKHSEITADAVQSGLNISPATPSGRGAAIDTGEVVEKPATANGSNRNALPLKPQEVQQKMMQKMLEAQPELDKVIKTLEKKVLKMLSPDQKQLWKEMQGSKFTFRQSD